MYIYFSRPLSEYGGTFTVVDEVKNGARERGGLLIFHVEFSPQVYSQWCSEKYRNRLVSINKCINQPSAVELMSCVSGVVLEIPVCVENVSCNYDEPRPVRFHGQIEYTDLAGC